TSESGSYLANCRDGHNRTFMPQARRELKEIGWTKSHELAKSVPRDSRGFDGALEAHKGQEMRREDFRREVERVLTRREQDASDLHLFQDVQASTPVIEQAIKDCHSDARVPIDRGLLCGDGFVRIFLGENSLD